MGKQWIYVLKAGDGTYFIGETANLYTSFSEHLTDKKTLLPKFDSITLIGLYNGVNNEHFINFHKAVNDELENLFQDTSITSSILGRWMTENGKNLTCDNIFVQQVIADQYKTLYPNALTMHPKHLDISPTLHRPLCKCCSPADVSIGKRGEITFRCALSNASWIEYKNPKFFIDRRCSFTEKYTGDTRLVKKYMAIEEIQGTNSRITQLPVLSTSYEDDKDWVQEKPCLFCDRIRYKPLVNSGQPRQCCPACLLNRYEEIKEYTDALT